MNMITSAWMKKSRSIGIPGVSPMSAPPLRSAPKTSDVATTPLGRVPPTRAIAIAVKPTPPEIAVSILAELTAVRYGYRVPEPVQIKAQAAVEAGCAT